MQKFLVSAAVAVVLLVGAMPAQASSTLAWSGVGMRYLACPNGAVWVLTPTTGVTDPVLDFKGHLHPMRLTNNATAYRASTFAAVSRPGSNNWPASTYVSTNNNSVSVTF